MKIFIAWYRKEDYPALLSIIDDPERMPKKYERWLEIAEKGLENLWQAGYDVSKSVIDINKLKKWCEETGKENVLENRAAFAAIPTLHCLRCLHVWYARSPENPKQCPKCRSPYWDKPRRTHRNPKQS